ncbi:fimbrial protein, partial [Escherichia coli]|uniref:fimbrial protein n=1 Tax=Escherichia coli TaxID=562 RepID=UPI0038FCAD09
MIRLSLFISLLLTSVAVLADVQINIRGNIYIPPCTINNGQNIVVDFGNINPEHVDAYFHERRSLNNFHRDRVITFEQIAE